MYLGTGGEEELGENENQREDSKKQKTPNTEFLLDCQGGKQFTKRRTEVKPVSWRRDVSID